MYLKMSEKLGVPYLPFLPSAVLERLDLGPQMSNQALKISVVFQSFSSILFVVG